MWWTQPKLAFIVLGINGCVVLVFSAATFVWPALAAGGRGAALLVAQACLLLGYALVARRLGRQHLEGATRGAFDANIWNKPWGPRSGAFEYWAGRTHDHWANRNGFEYRADDSTRDAAGMSFYRHVLGSAPAARDSLYDALSLWEGSRLLWHGETISMAAALASGTLLLEVAAGLGIAGAKLPWLAATLLPVTILLLPEVAKIFLLKRRLLRHRTVERIAALAPRDAVDLGLQAEEPFVPAEFRRDLASVTVVFLGVPVALAVAVAAGPRVAGLGLTALVAALVAVVVIFRAFRAFVVRRIPFLTYRGPLEISVALDMAHRQRAWLSLVMLPGLAYVLMLAGPLNDPGDAPPVFMTLYWLAYIVAITFGDQLAGYAGFGTASRFAACLDRSMAKLEATPS